MKGYKGFDKELRCLDMRYAVGESYTVKGPLVLCKNGFHFCKTVAAVNNYYSVENSRVCEIEAFGEVKTDGKKYITDKMRIIRELPRDEILSLANTGTGNTGIMNSGDQNSGHRNSGNWNSGHRNSGDRNSGNWNSGNWNSGHRNSGHRNSGDFCSCNGASGVFMSRRIHYEAFDKALTEAEYSALIRSPGYWICTGFHLVKYRVRAATGKHGDYRYLGYKASWRVFWNGLSVKERLAVRKMPHFDAAVFYQITGITV
jgi:hypothetical protein